MIDEKCVGCLKCIKACPAEALVMVYSPEEEKMLIPLEETTIPATDKRPVAVERWKGVWVFVEQTNGKAHPVSWELLGIGRILAEDLGVSLSAFILGSQVRRLVEEVFGYGADSVYVVDDPVLSHYRTRPYLQGTVNLIHKYKPEMDLFKKYDIQKIITLCPHCFSTLKNDYRQYGAEFEVIHHTQLIQRLFTEKKISVNEKAEGRTVLHDSCYLGRYNNIFEEPRQVLAAVSVSGAPLEMERHRSESFCCGAGGGRMWMEENLGKRIYLERTEEALRTNPSTIAVACPYCMTMFVDGVKEVKTQDAVHVKDIAEVVAEAIG